MTARDRFRAQLKCPKCGREGEVHFSELDGYSYAFGNKDTSVESLPEGFKVVNQRTGIASVDIYCATCDVSALVTR